MGGVRAGRPRSQVGGVRVVRAGRPRSQVGVVRAGRPRSQVVGLYPRARFLHQVGKCGQRDELAWGEEVFEMGHAVKRREHRAAIRRNFCLRLPRWPRAAGDRLVFGGGRQVDAPAFTFGDNRHQARAHTPGLSFGFDVVSGDWHARHDAAETGAARQFGAVFRFRRRRAVAGAGSDGEAVASPLPASSRWGEEVAPVAASSRWGGGGGPPPSLPPLGGESDSLPRRGRAGEGAGAPWVSVSITGSTHASLPGFVESMNVEASGTSTWANAGLGLFTVRAQSQAMTVSF